MVPFGSLPDGVLERTAQTPPEPPHSGSSRYNTSLKFDWIQ